MQRKKLVKSIVILSNNSPKFPVLLELKSIVNLIAAEFYSETPKLIEIRKEQVIHMHGHLENSYMYPANCFCCYCPLMPLDSAATAASAPTATDAARQCCYCR